MRILACMALVSMSCPMAARADDWFTLDALSAPSGMIIEIDADTLRVSGTTRPEVTVRLTHPKPRVHSKGGSYLSIVATVEFDCEGRLAGYRNASFYAEGHGQGALVQRQREPMAPVTTRTLELLSPAVLQQFTRAACAGKLGPAQR